MVSTIGSVDPNHLVSLGTIGSGQCGAAGGEGYRFVHAGMVDLCEYHDYGAPDSAMPGDRWNGLGVRIDDCRALGKPIFVGEAGICVAQALGCTKATGMDGRARQFDAKLRAQFKSGVAGYLVWATLSGAGWDDPYVIPEGDPTEAVMRAAHPCVALGRC